MTSKYTSLKRGIKAKEWSWNSLRLDTWFFEIFMTIFSIACFIGICVILIIYDQKSLPKFSYGFSMNAIVSVLATSCKSSLIFAIGEAIGQLKWVWFNGKPKKLLDIQTFDSASRGPLGSITILFQKTRRSIVSFGAAVMILLVAFDPFIQQIINYPTRLTAMQNNTSFAIAKKLDYFITEIEYPALISTGIWSDDITPSPPKCSSGNCTWPNFQSVGICSQCSDITDSTDLECEIGDDNPNLTSESGEKFRSVNVTCYITAPQGETIYIDQEFRLSSKNSTYQTSTLTWPLFAMEFEDSPKFVWSDNQRTSNPLIVIAYSELGYNENNLDSDFLGGISIVKATQCSLELCLLEYEISVENGIPNTVSSVLNYGQLFYRNYSHPDGIHNPLFGPQQLCWKPTSSQPDITKKNRGDSYTQLSPVEFTFCGIFYTELTLSMGIFSGSFSRKHVWYPGGADNRDNPVTNSGDLYVRHISQVGLENAMSNIAKQVNKEALRINGSEVHGTAHASEIYVEVKWLWLILPTILVVSGTTFIAIVIFQSRKNGESLWKSSVLAFLYHGLHDVEKDESMAAASVMEKKAEELVVRLQASEDGGLILQEEKNLV